MSISWGLIWGGNESAPSPAEYEEMGLRIALYPTFTSTYAIQAIWQLLNDFRERGPEALADNLELRRAMTYGSVLASYNVEEFGTERVARLTRREIDERYSELRRMTSLGDLP